MKLLFYGIGCLADKLKSGIWNWSMEIRRNYFYVAFFGDYSIIKWGPITRPFIWLLK